MESTEWSKEHSYGSAKGINWVLGVSIHGALTPPRVDPKQRSPHESDLEGLIITPPNRRHDREEIRRLLAETSLIQLRVLDSYRREDCGRREPRTPAGFPCRAAWNVSGCQRGNE